MILFLQFYTMSQLSASVTVWMGIAEQKITATFMIELHLVCPDLQQKSTFFSMFETEWARLCHAKGGPQLQVVWRLLLHSSLLALTSGNKSLFIDDTGITDVSPTKSTIQ